MIAITTFGHIFIWVGYLIIAAIPILCLIDVIGDSYRRR